VTISAEGKITDVNEATVNVTGYAREQLIGTDFSDYFTEPEKARAGYQRVFADGFVIDYPLTICSRDGRLTDVLYNASVYRDTRGHVTGVFAAARDVTARKRAEEALKKAYDTLEEKVAERTAELKRSNEELEQFAYVASHDLQEPLRMVASYVQLLGQRYKGQLDEKADRYIAYASEGAIRMHRLVNDLLSLSRVGTRTTPMLPVRLDRIVSQARDNLATAIYQSGAEVEVGPLPEVSGDQTQLIQLFQNLLDNAIKFHGPEPPLIRIDAGMAKTGTVPRPARSDGGEATRSEGLSPVFADTETWGQGDAGTTSAVRSSADVRPGFVTIRVSDNGIGIDPKYADRIFGLFKRLHSEKEYPGTGIGLAVCKKIVERHGGTIRVESEPGRGSTFIFTLPAAGRESP
jgi:PAS domain S-box-containing protein